MRTLFGNLIAVGVVAVAASGPPALAGETGTLKGRGVLVVTSSQTIAVPGRPDHQVIPSVMDGSMITDERGAAFDGARYQIVDMVDSAGMVNGGYKTFTTADGSMLFARYRTLDGSGAHYTGKWEITGGTGKFEGATGGGTWDGTFVADSVLIDTMDGIWTTP
jgi:hypothetical protein